MGGRPENDTDEALITQLGSAFAKALLTGDEVEAERAVRAAIDAGLAAAVIDDEVIAPALWLVGRLWERGEISIADEHLATEITLRVLALQREVSRTAARRSGHRVLLAAVAGELHVVALRMVANLLRDAGYDVRMLGADVPVEALAEAAARHEADIVCLSTTMPGGGDRMLLAIDAVQSERPETVFVVGGRGVSGRLRPHAGLTVCDRVREVVEAVDAAVKRADMN
jgi:MerR family transcriptional regulator, light-induced transcriptional regulator